jgi:hypothetical protein
MGPMIVFNENPTWEVRKYIWASLYKEREKELDDQAEELRSTVCKCFCPLHPEAVQLILISHEETFSGISVIVCCELLSASLMSKFKKLSFEPEVHHIRDIRE